MYKFCICLCGKLSKKPPSQEESTEAAPENDNPKKESKDEIGYSVHRFVSENLIPVEGFACRSPMDEKRAKELRNEIKALNMQLKEIAERKNERNRWANDYPGDQDTIFNNKDIPNEALCRVKLDEADIGDAKQSFDFNQESRLELKVRGKLLFPPAANFSTKEKGNKKKDEYDSNLVINIEVDTILERASDGDALDDDEDTTPADGRTRLQVKCVKLHPVRSEENGGDAMIESWLPVPDVLKYIEFLLGDNLQEQIQGIEAE